MDCVVPEPSLYIIKGILILDNDGNRIIAKYYDDTYPTLKEQKVFEKNLYEKTHKANAEIIMLEGFTCVYRSNIDLFFYVLGSSHENELILINVLSCFYDAVNYILRKNVEKRLLLENLDAIFLAIDELCDQGIIMENDAIVISQKVIFRSDDIPLGEQTVAQVLNSAKEQFKWLK